MRYAVELECAQSLHVQLQFLEIPRNCGRTTRRNIEIARAMGCSNRLRESRTCSNSRDSREAQHPVLLVMFSFRRCYQDVILSVPSILDVQY